MSEEKKVRERGFHWVRNHFTNKWMVAYYDGEHWRVHGNYISFPESSFAEIDERRITREPEPSQEDIDKTKKEAEAWDDYRETMYQAWERDNKDKP